MPKVPLQTSLFSLLAAHGFDLISNDVCDASESPSDLAMDCMEAEDGSVYSYSFYHPVTGEKMCIEVYVPGEVENDDKEKDGSVSG